MNQSNQAEGVRSAQSSGEKRSIYIGGDANDAVIIQGDNNNVIVHRSDQRVTVKPLATPIFVNRPNQEIPLLDRETERDAVQHALMAGE
ncbi:MAG: hypothetical protein HYR93_07055, partial [Chloroflexi bacterium]|nr:hypothetical protein [Chloroflexota bacterium]